MILIPIPLELVLEIGLNPLDVIQFRTDGNKLIIEPVTDSDFECDNDCDNCPFFELDCDGDCDSCPCNDVCDESEVNFNE